MIFLDLIEFGFNLLVNLNTRSIICTHQVIILNLVPLQVEHHFSKNEIF